MSKLYTVLLLLAGTRVTAQNAIFHKYPFEKGGYAIVGLLSDNRQNRLQSLLGEFYTDDPVVLNEFKRNWVFSKKITADSCNAQYSIQLTHHGKIIQDCLVNLDCRSIATDKGRYYFNPENLGRLQARLSKPAIKKFSFTSNTEGRRFIDSIKKDTNLLLTFEPFWTRFEGRFSFLYKIQGKKTAVTATERMLNLRIKKQYPSEKFLLFLLPVQGTGAYELQLICNKTLFDRFTLYPKNSNWKEYSRDLTTVWK